MQQTGQAYSTFKLLIAAIIAVAILYILLSILGGITIFGSDIQTVVKQMIQKQVNSEGQLDTSAQLIFSGNTTLTPSALVGTSGLSNDQICIHKGQLRENEILQVRGKSILNTAGDLRVKASVMCAKANEVINNLDELGFEISESDFGGYEGDAGTECGCFPPSTQKCCVVYLLFA